MALNLLYICFHLRRRSTLFYVMIYARSLRLASGRSDNIYQHPELSMVVYYAHGEVNLMNKYQHLVSSCVNNEYKRERDCNWQCKHSYVKLRVNICACLTRSRADTRVKVACGVERLCETLEILYTNI